MWAGVHLHIGDKLAAHDAAACLLDALDQGLEDALCHRALAPADVEVVLVGQGCRGVSHWLNASKAEAACRVP